MLSVCGEGGELVCTCVYACPFREREGSGQCALKTWTEISEGES